MKIVCAWCGKDMEEKNGNYEDGVSHGMCEECFTKIKAENGICEDNEPDAITSRSGYVLDFCQDFDEI